MKKENENRKDFMLKEIEVVQGIIRRMASNSFMIKGWGLTLIVVTLLLKGTKYQVWITFIPLLVFWYLDAYFLRQERLYRKLYEWIIKNRLKTDKYLFDMNTSRFSNKISSNFIIMFSITLRWFYGSIFVLIVIYLFFLYLIQNGGC